MIISLFPPYFRNLELDVLDNIFYHHSTIKEYDQKHAAIEKKDKWWLKTPPKKKMRPKPSLPSKKPPKKKKRSQICYSQNSMKAISV